MEMDSNKKRQRMVACVHAVGMAYGISGGLWYGRCDGHRHCAVHVVHPRFMVSKSARRWSTLR